MKPTLESYMREWVIRLERAERPDGSVYVSSPTFPLFRVVVPKSENVLKYASTLLEEYMQLNTNREFKLRTIDDASALFDGEQAASHIPAYVIAEAAA
jgi:hypothetical protein